MPRASKAARTLTRRAPGISCSALIRASGPAINRTRVCAAPKSAASSVAHATRSGKRPAYSESRARVAGVETFSRLQLASPRASSSSTAHRICANPSSTPSAVAPAPRAVESSVQGGDACTWSRSLGGGSSTASPSGPSVASTALPDGTLADHTRSGTASRSTPRTTVAPAASAPAEKPPRPTKRSTTSRPAIHH